MLTVSVTVGRLLEIRGRETLDIAQFAAFRSQFTDALLQIGKRAVFIVDLRGMQVVSDQVYEALLRLMKTDTPLMEKVAYLLERRSLLEVKISQVIEAANNPSRKVCADVGEVERWLAPSLTPDELARVHAFLAE